MDCDVVHHEEVVGSGEKKEPANEAAMSPESPSQSECPVNLRTSSAQSLPDNEHQSEDEPLVKDSIDLLYEGEDVDFKMLFDDKVEVANDVEIDVRGIKYKIPYAIECHLCNEMMNLCLRRTRYRGQTREYPAYRCNRKGCQTFRSIRKVFSNCVTDSDDKSSPRMVYQPTLNTTPPRTRAHRTEYSDDDGDDLVIQRVFLPKPEKQLGDAKPLSVTDRVRRANQERAVVFSEFADQLRRDIAANKRIRVRKQINEEEEQQGTLFYINKELNPQEIIELQDSIIKKLIALRKIPPPMSMLDLPLFANCPYSKRHLEAGLESTKNREDFWSAFTNSPQPPLPVGFVRRKDDTLIYRDPKPYQVPEILQQNSPRKQAEAALNYKHRKEEQDAKRMERRHTEKKYRTWASLKREFDMAETDDYPTMKSMKRCFENAESKGCKITLQELIDKMEGGSKGRMTGTIRAGDGGRLGDQLLWIDDRMAPDDQGGSELQNRLVKDESSHSSMSEMMGDMSSPMLRPYSSADHVDLKQHSAAAHEQMYYSNLPFNNSYGMNAYYQYTMPSMDPNAMYQSRDVSNDHYQCVGASEVVSTEAPPPPPPMNHFTYVHPDSGVPLTDPSAFLNSFVPSPVIKVCPEGFNQETARPRHSSEPSTSTAYEDGDAAGSSEKPADEVGSEENKKTMDCFLKFDPPSC